MIARWGDRLPGTNTRFGYNADFTAFVAMPGANEGVLFVNHEYVSLPEFGKIGVYSQTFRAVMGRAPRIEDEMHDVGVSVLHIRQTAAGRWQITTSPLTRRYDAQSRMIASGPALQNTRGVGGTLANCSGCHTPWNTVLTCEENFQDCVPEAVDRSVYIAFTANATAPDHLFPNMYGEIWRIVEDGDGTGTRFTWMRWKAGGPSDPRQAGHVFAAPDSLAFDAAGNMWIVTDIATEQLNADTRYTAFQNNGMFFVSGPDAGVALQFASAPCEAELAGRSWTPDRQTLFLSIQHPGEAHGIRTAAMTAPRGSNWPSGRVGNPPLPDVVSIRRQ